MAGGGERRTKQDRDCRVAIRVAVLHRVVRTVWHLSRGLKGVQSVRKACTVPGEWRSTGPLPGRASPVCQEKSEPGKRSGR